MEKMTTPTTKQPILAPNSTDQWQTKCSNINEVFEHLFVNPIGADICFVPLLNASNPPKEFPAHKAVLIARSSAFLTLFQQNQMQNKNDIQKMELPDVDPEAFEELLRFCYTDQAEITKENADSIRHIANRFGVLTLGALASKFIGENVRTFHRSNLSESEQIIGQRRQTRKITRQTEAKQSSISKSTEYLCMNPIGADICFVPLLNAPDPPKKFPAHKIVLLGRSPVFQAQFHWDQMTNGNEENEDAGEAPAPKKAKQNDNLIQEVELPDIEPQAFEQFLCFCYADKAEITGENVASVLYTANRYNVPALVKQAVKFICDNVKPENAYEMLDFANKLWVKEMNEIEECALACIRNHTKKALKSDGFLGVSQQRLDLFASQHFLKITEIELFEELIRWAKYHRKIPGNGKKTLRELLGPGLFRIQFGKMDIADFQRVVVPAKVLTDDESAYVSKKLRNNAEDETFFSDPECPFLEKFETQREITNYNKMTSEKMFGQDVYIDVFTFFLVCRLRCCWIYCKTTQRIIEHPGISLSIQCAGDGKRWGCWATIELMLVSKTPDKKDKSLGKFSHHFYADYNSYDCSRFLPLFQELVDPENGWIRDDTVTLKARVKVGAEPEEKVKENGGKEEAAGQQN